jgi:GntR family transcriptional repressor for pyruvate dehydrogenase complex
MNKDLPYRVVTPPPRQRLSDSIALQVEELIVQGALRPGQELPAERVLAPRFGVSRPSLREALLRLEARGLLKVTRGGRFAVTDVTAPTMTDPLVHLLQRHPDAEQDVLEMRHGLEMVAAQFAAERATREDRERLRRAYDNMIKTRDRRDTLADAEADADFHLAIAEASHNVALIHVMRGIYNLLRTCMRHAWEVMFQEPENVGVLHGQHRALLEAVLKGDPERARNAAHLHLNYVRESLQQLDRPGRTARTKKAAARRRKPVARRG